MVVEGSLSREVQVALKATLKLDEFLRAYEVVRGDGSQCHGFVSGTALRRIVRVVWEFPRDSTRPYILVNITSQYIVDISLRIGKH